MFSVSKARRMCGDFRQSWKFASSVFEDAHKGRVCVHVFIGMSMSALWVSELYYIIKKYQLVLKFIHISTLGVSN